MADPQNDENKNVVAPHGPDAVTEAQVMRPESSGDADRAFKAAHGVASDEAHNTHPGKPNEHSKRDEIQPHGQKP